jgi:hypothetical protein
MLNETALGAPAGLSEEEASSRLEEDGYFEPTAFDSFSVWANGPNTIGTQL